MGGTSGAIITVLIYSFALPIGLLIWWKKRSGESLWCFIAGAICFMLFAMTLESLLHAFMLSGNNPVSAAILLHALADAPAALYQYKAISSLTIVEACAFVLGLFCLATGKKALDNKAEKEPSAE